jgi:hypothetical protein
MYRSAFFTTEQSDHSGNPTSNINKMIAETATGALVAKSKSIAVYFGISAPIVLAIDFLGLNIDILIIWAVFITIDTILGWSIAIWLNNFSSRSAQDRGARKAVLVMIVFCFGLLGTQHFTIAYLASTLLMSFTLAELISIIRHGYTIYFRERLPESEIIKNIFNSILQILTKKTEIVSNK